MIFLNSGKPLSDEELRKVERSLGVEFPPEYRTFLLGRNGGELDPPLAFENPQRRSRTGTERLQVDRFLSVTENPQSLNDLVSTVEFQRSELDLPHHLVPIAVVMHEDFLLLSTSGEDRGKIYYWYYIEGGFDEDAPVHIADSLDDFLKQLKPSQGRERNSQ